MFESTVGTVLLTGVEVMVWLVVSYVFVSLVEYHIHRYLMHDKKLPEGVYERNPYLLEVYTAHAIRHHREYYKEFDYEPDAVGKTFNLLIARSDRVIITVLLIPLFLLLLWVAPIGAVILAAAAFLHNETWNIIHRQMHIPRDVFFKDWRVFHFLARYHFLHHQDNGKNFNVVLPFSDWLRGTLAKASPADIREMMRPGYLDSKHPMVQKRIERNRRNHLRHRGAQQASAEPLAVA